MKLYNISELEKTGLVKAIYTGSDTHGWGYCSSEGTNTDIDNYRELSAVMGIPIERMVRINQTHTNAVRIIEEEHAGEGILRPNSIEGFDGMITERPGILLGTVEADCVPVYMLDPVNKVIGMVHSGWKGTAGLISVNALRLMQESFRSNPEDVLVALGPCIHGRCYEVTEDLIPSFEANYSGAEIDEIFTVKDNGRYWLDLPTAIKKSLYREGISSQHFYDSPHCTLCEKEFHSYRRSGPGAGRMLTGIVLL